MGKQEVLLTSGEKHMSQGEEKNKMKHILCFILFFSEILTVTVTTYDWFSMLDNLMRAVV